MLFFMETNWRKIVCASGKSALLDKRNRQEVVLEPWKTLGNGALNIRLCRSSTSLNFMLR